MEVARLGVELELQLPATATDPIQPPAWELPHAMGTALKRPKKKKKKRERERDKFVYIYLTIFEVLFLYKRACKMLFH